MSWVEIGIGACVVAGMLYALTAQLGAVLTRFPPLVWPVLRAGAGLAMLGFAGWIALAPTNRITQITCPVTELVLEPLEGGEVDVTVRVEWQAGGREYRLREPMRLTRERASAETLTARYANQRVPCFYRNTTPSRIFLGDGARHTRAQWQKAAAVAVPALVLVAFTIIGWSRRKRASAARTDFWLSSRGIGGALAIIVIVVGLVQKTWLVGGLGGALLLALIVREVVKADRALAYLRRAFHLVANDGMFETLTGKRADSTIEIIEKVDELRVTVKLAGWPDGVALVHEPATDPIGDPTFDAVFTVTGPALAWRCLLTPDLRAALVAVGDAIDATGWHAMYPDDIASGTTIEADIERVLAIGALIQRRPPATVEHLLAVAHGEPIAAVRLGHYRWLVETGHPVASIALAAANDPDLEIREWARTLVGPSDGAFR